MKKKVILRSCVITLCIIILGIAVGILVRNVKENNKSERRKLAQKKEYEERNRQLYNKYSGEWYAKENDGLYFRLYKNDKGAMCVEYTHITGDGTLVRGYIDEVSLCVSQNVQSNDNNSYLQVYFNGPGDASGWTEFRLFDGDDSKLGYEEIVYYKR